MNCDTPTLLDWISGVAVPVMLGLGTLFVAIWAGGIAKASNRINEKHHEESRLDDAKKRRIAFVHELALLSGSFSASAISGQKPAKAVMEDSAGLQRFARAQADADDPTSKELTAWVSRKAQGVPKGDFDAWLIINEETVAMMELWKEDPRAAIEMIRAEATSE